MVYVKREKIKTSSSLNNLSMTQGNCNYAPLYFNNFATYQQAKLFQELRNSQFSGKISCQNPQGEKSNIYWYLGRIIYANGGTHPVRRWRRTVLEFCPKIKASGFQSIPIQRDIAASLIQDHPIGWDYDVLCSWFKQQKINRTQLLEIINSIVIEILFDLMQSREVTCHFDLEQTCSSPFVFFDPQQMIVATWKMWQNWHRSTLGDRSPNEAPIIKSIEELKQRTSPKTYDVLSKNIQGNRSLRDLSVHMNQDLLRLTSSLSLYVQLDLIGLVKIEDLPQPLALSGKKTAVKTQEKLIACVDDDPKTCQLFKDIVEKQGYKFLGIHDSRKAIPLLVHYKPDLIFVDLEMPNIDGWEICRRLRKILAPETSPTILLVQNQGMFERLQTKVVGGAGLLSKPFNKQEILNIIFLHIPTEAVA
ncbi:MAG: response regulator [Crocosphaera sp.]|nr:response regulator [Crocosphaera sp.]